MLKQSLFVRHLRIDETIFYTIFKEIKKNFVRKYSWSPKNWKKVWSKPFKTGVNIIGFFAGELVLAIAESNSSTKFEENKSKMASWNSIYYESLLIAIAPS